MIQLLGLIEVSDEVLLVAGMDIPNIKNVKIGLQTLRLLNTPMSKLRLVLNRANSKVKLDVGEVERTLLDMRERLGISTVLVTHDLDQARRMAEWVVRIEAGIATAQGPVKELLAA